MGWLQALDLDDCLNSLPVKDQTKLVCVVLYNLYPLVSNVSFFFRVDSYLRLISIKLSPSSAISTYS